MRKTKNNESFPGWVLLGIILLLLIVLYYIFRSEKIKQYRDDLKERINEKEQYIESLIKELNRLIAMKGYLTNQAIRFFKLIKLALFLLLLSIGIVAYALFNLSSGIKGLEKDNLR